MSAMRDLSAMHGMSGVSHFANNVVLPLDGSETSKAALPVARTLAELQESTLHVVYVSEEGAGPRLGLQDLGLSGREFHGAVLNQVTGDAAPYIISLTHDLTNALIVMSTHGAEQTEESLGPLAEAVLRAVPPQIVLLSPNAARATWNPRRILLAHDGTPSADSALLPTATIAQLTGAEAIALHVAARQAETPEEPGSLPAPRYIDQPQHEWPSWTQEFVTRMLALGGSPEAINFKLLVTGGQPGSEIAQFALDNAADLVVLPWHGNWEEQRGGAVEAVVRRCGCPVLLICKT